ncbi:MAG TPA: sulfatase-like hydrolase/transferase [Sideroxyarcus sp.]|nr:sulfatase-like hydrolase/transferase [Sideroxyarcus sp.]
MTKSGQRNLILLTVDAWRADFTEAFEGMPLLPALDEVAGHSVRFEQCYANAPWTTPALLSILTGESPVRHGVCYQWSAPRADSPGMAKHLGGKGYALPNVCYLNSINGYQNLGFGPCPVADVAHAANDGTLITALRQQRNNRAPFFLWYHYKFLHLPYWPGAAYRQRLGIDDEAIPQRLRESLCSEWNLPRDKYRFLPADRDIVRRLYAAELLEFNDFLWPLIEELLRGDLLERTTLVLTADHGDEHLEHGHVGHASTAEHATLYEEVLHVPLVVVDPRIGGPRRIAARIQGMDLYPTLLSLAGEPVVAGPGAFDFAPAIIDSGGALPEPGRTFYFHGARMGFRTPPEREGQIIEGISDGRFKFVAERYEAPRFMLYDLANDPAELASSIWAAGQEEPGCLSALARLGEVKAGLKGGC